MTDLRPIVEELMETEGWMTTDALARAIRERDCLDAEWRAAAEERALRYELRKLLRTSKDADGWPRYGNVIDVDEQGNRIQLYKQETLFDVDDYRQVMESHGRIANHHVEMMIGYREHCQSRYDVQLPLPLEVFRPREKRGDEPGGEAPDDDE